VILAVVSGKGGVGKSTGAYNLAAELDAVCVDADLGMADLPTRRGPSPHPLPAYVGHQAAPADESRVRLDLAGHEPVEKPHPFV
jgi:septum site-determining protein MinD